MDAAAENYERIASEKAIYEEYYTKERFKEMHSDSPLFMLRFGIEKYYENGVETESKIRLTIDGSTIANIFALTKYEG